MARETVIHLSSLTLELSETEFRAVKNGEGVVDNVALKNKILAKVKANLDNGDGVEYAEEL
jgi:hypothetical protein